MAPASDGGSPITGYTVTSLPAGGVDSNAGATGLSHVVTGLTNGTAYTFTVTATNAVGSSAASAASNSVTPATVPGAPTNVHAAGGNTQATVTFTAPADDGGSAITGYTATSNPDGFSGTCTASPCMVNGLTNGMAYTFTVTATNAVGTGPDSGPSNSIIPGPVLNVYYIYPDQLGTPRQITDTSDNVVWQWDNTDPFGANMPNENPNGAGTFNFNLRFPGQYFDTETNTHYNINRDYDPAIGAYKQFDPIGLAGGINGYTYVEGNPLSYVDPLGLYSWDEFGSDAANAAVGFGDGAFAAITLGIGDLQEIRDAFGIDGDIDRSSSLYCGFQTAGKIVGGAALGGVALNRASQLSKFPAFRRLNQNRYLRTEMQMQMGSGLAK